jgi:hypothetical protein
MKFSLLVVNTVVLVLIVLASGCIGDLQSKSGVGNFGGTPSPAITAGTGIPLPVTSQTSGTTSGFTCEFNQGLLDASAEYRTWFNASCYYNTYCGWFESNDLLKPISTPDCVNCSLESFPQQAPPAQTPCPVRTTKPGTTASPAVTTSDALSSGTCGSGLTQCRVFSTDYCVDLLTDVKHCGACRKGCLLVHAENGCSAGTCYIKKCDFGWADCNGKAEDGCEVDLNADDNNCGKCGRVCSLPNAGLALCNGVDENGKCEVEHCATGWLNANGLHEDGCEVFQN